MSPSLSKNKDLLDSKPVNYQDGTCCTATLSNTEGGEESEESESESQQKTTS